MYCYVTQVPSSPEHVESPIKIPYPPLEEEEQATKLKSSQRRTSRTKEKSMKTSKSLTEPQYSVLYRGEVDMLDFAVDIGSEGRRGREKQVIVPLRQSMAYSEAARTLFLLLLLTKNSSAE